MGRSVVGIDPSISMLTEASERGAEHLVLGRGESLPFCSESFGFCYLVDVIHHLADRTAFAQEVHRVLMPGGLIVIATDSELDIPRGFRWPDISRKPCPMNLADIPIPKTIESVLAAAGSGGARTAVCRASLRPDRYPALSG